MKIDLASQLAEMSAEELEDAINGGNSGLIASMAAHWAKQEGLTPEQATRLKGLLADAAGMGRKNIESLHAKAAPTPKTAAEDAAEMLQAEANRLKGLRNAYAELEQHERRSAALRHAAMPERFEAEQLAEVEQRRRQPEQAHAEGQRYAERELRAIAKATGAMVATVAGSMVLAVLVKKALRQ